MNTVQSNQMKSGECFIAAVRVFGGGGGDQMSVLRRSTFRCVSKEAGLQHEDGRPVIHFVNLLLLCVVEGFPGLSHGGT